MDVDGVSYTILVVEAYTTYHDTTRPQFQTAERFDDPLIKAVAETIFGKDIEIRDPVAGEDLSIEDAMVDIIMLRAICPTRWEGRTLQRK